MKFLVRCKFEFDLFGYSAVPDFSTLSRIDLKNELLLSTCIWADLFV